MPFKNFFAVFSGKTVSWLIKEYSLGAASTWPGHIALKLNPTFIRDYLKNKKIKIILIAGTNGKTTTSKLLTHILESENRKVFQNEEGANLLNGMATSIIRNTNRLGKPTGNVAVFEVDESNLPGITEQITPDAVVLLNLFRDQLDRYGEVNTIAHKWIESLRKLPNSVQFIINADDPQLQFIGNHLKNIHYFGLNDNLMKETKLGHDVDSSYCPQCGEKLLYKKIAYSHLGSYECTKCTFKRKTIITFPDAPIPLAGMYNRYNTYASLLTATQLFETPIDKAYESIKTFIPAFGRQETIVYKKHKIIMMLSKNPTGFNQSVEAVQELSANKKINLLLLLNDRIPDGKDVSWIWDTDIEKLVPLAQNIYISGDRPYDMALRIKYADESQNTKFKNPWHRGQDRQNLMSKVKTYDNLKMATNEAINQTGKDETLFILPTYSAMLEVRKILTGKSIL